MLKIDSHRYTDSTKKKYISEVRGRSLNREIVSFRFVRSCVRARGLVVEWKSGSNPVRVRSLFPFALRGFSLFP